MPPTAIQTDGSANWLLIAGVMAVAVGMTLRRRQGDELGQDGDRALRDPATVPPTPDGEIVAGGERRS